MAISLSRRISIPLLSALVIGSMGVTATVSASTASASTASASTASAGTAAAASAQRGIGPGTRMFVPPPSQGAPRQILQLAASGDIKDAALLATMEAIPRAVWFTSGTPAQVRQQAGQTMLEAAAERAVPVLVAYDIPGRDCAQYSAGGALSQADYEAWIDGFAGGIKAGKAVVILEPDALGNLPSGCGLPSSVYPFTDTERFAELQYAVASLEKDPGVSVYLDGTHSAWQSVGTITQRLLAGQRAGHAGTLPGRVELPADTGAGGLRDLDLGLHRHGHQPRERLLQQPVRLREPVLPGHAKRLQHLGPHDPVVRPEHGQRGGEHPFRHRH